jgi:hypothetical protein
MFEDIRRNIRHKFPMEKYKQIDKKTVDIYTDRLLSFFVNNYFEYEHDKIKNGSKSMLLVNSKNRYCYYDSSDQILVPKLRLKIRELVLLLKCLISVLLAIFSREKSIQTPRSQEVYLIYSLTNEQLLDSNGFSCSVFLNDFFNNDNSLKIIETSGPNFDEERNIYVTNILKYLIINFSKNLKISIFKETLKILFQRINLILLDSRSIIGAAHYFEGLLTKIILENARLKTIFICTQTTLISNPGIFYFSPKEQNFMFWYSDNSLQLTPSEKFTYGNFDYSYLKSVNIGSHYVLSHSFKKLLNEVNKNVKVEVILPFSFFNHYPISKKMVKGVFPSKKYVSYFPVTPFMNSRNSIYTEAILIKDLELIVKVMKNAQKRDNDISLKIKVKREFSKMHSKKYFDYLNNVSAKYAWIEVLNPKTDVVNQILFSELVVCTPFTSIALLGKYLHRKVVYFSTASNFYPKRSYEKIPLVNDEKNLQFFLDK